MNVQIRVFERSDAEEAAFLYRQGIPNALLSRLKGQFLQKYLIGLSQEQVSRIMVATNHLNHVIGIIGGTVQRRGCLLRIVKQKAWELLPDLMMNASPSIAKEILKYLRSMRTINGKSTTDTVLETERTTTELNFITISADYRNMGLGKMLITEFEIWLSKTRGIEKYIIRTECINTGASRLYASIGARLIRKIKHRDMLICEYEKKIGLAD